jgi:hypothetical protein
MNETAETGTVSRAERAPFPPRGGPTCAAMISARSTPCRPCPWIQHVPSFFSSIPCLTRFRPLSILRGQQRQPRRQRQSQWWPQYRISEAATAVKQQRDGVAAAAAAPTARSARSQLPQGKVGGNGAAPTRRSALAPSGTGHIRGRSCPRPAFRGEGGGPEEGPECEDPPHAGLPGKRGAVLEGKERKHRGPAPAPAPPLRSVLGPFLP